MTLVHAAPPGRRQPRTLAAPRLSPLPPDDWTDAARDVVATLGVTDHIDNGLATLLHLPALAESVTPYTTYLSTASTLSARQRALLILRSAWLCGSVHLWAAHVRRARQSGLSAADIHRIAAGAQAAGWNDIDAVLLTIADQLFASAAISDAAWRSLTAVADVQHCLDVVETVNHFVALSMLFNAIGVQADSADDAFPADVPYRLDVPAREAPLSQARVEPLPGDGYAALRTFQHHPALNAPRVKRLRFINSLTPLSPRHREILILRIGWNCQSEYEWAQHVGSVGRARDHGLEPVEIARGAASPVWTPLERTLLHVADELYTDTTISDRTWDALAGHFDTPAILAALFTTASYWALSASLNAFGVQLEPGNEHFPR